MKRLLLMLSIGWSLSLQAQQNPQTAAPMDTMKMSLQDCIDYALKNSNAVKNITLDQEIASARVKEATGAGLPQISGSVAVQHNFKLRPSVLPKAALSRFGAGDAINALPNNTIGVFPNFFQLPTTLDASVTASQILFSSSYIVGLQAAKTYRELAEKSSQQTKQETAISVVKAYYMLVIAQERIKLFSVNLARLDSTLKQTAKMNQQGFVEKLDVERLEVSYNNLLTEYEKTINLLSLSELSLKFQMGMPLGQPIKAKESIDNFTADTSLTSKANEFDITNRIEYQLLKSQKRGDELQVKNNLGSALPSLILSGTLGAFTSNQNLDFFSKKPYLDASNNLSYKAPIGNWFNYSNIQLGLSIPIFSGLQRTYRVQQSRLSLKKTQNDLKNFEQVAIMEVNSSLINVKNSTKSLEIQRRNMDLAKRIVDVTQKKFKAGTGSNLELTNAEASLKEAQINYFNSLYDFLVSKTDFEKATGSFKY